MPPEEQVSAKSTEIIETSPPPEISQEVPADNDGVVMISVASSLEGYKLRNFYIAVAFQQFAWITFHFTMIFFFTFQLKSIVMVGVFL